MRIRILINFLVYITVLFTCARVRDIMKVNENTEIFIIYNL